MILYIKKGMFTIWAKVGQRVGTQRNTETAVLHPKNLDEKIIQNICYIK